MQIILTDKFFELKQVEPETAESILYIANRLRDDCRETYIVNDEFEEALDIDFDTSYKVISRIRLLDIATFYLIKDDVLSFRVVWNNYNSFVTVVYHTNMNEVVNFIKLRCEIEKNENMSKQ
jgi:hypothetical protein